MITDVMRNADSEREVFALLSSYVGSLDVDEKFRCLSACAAALPLQRTEDIRACLSQLIIELDSASRNLDDHACLVLREAVHIFGTALGHLGTLRNRHRTAIAA